MLRGRAREQAALDELLDRARSGSGSVLVLRGEPGAGKSALVADTVARAEGFTVLRAQGVESEAPLAFAALHQLLRPVTAHLDDVPAPQAAALRAAFGEVDASVGDRHLVFLATLSLLSEAASRQPVLAVVDDAHWLDDASTAALLFTARRLEGEPVAMLLAAREGEQATEHDLPALRVSGVDEASADEIVADQAPGPVAPEVRAELLAATGGNPLGLVELTRALTAEQLSGRERLPDRLPVTSSIERAFLDRYHRLPPDARTLLLLAAADDSGRTSTVVRAAGALGVGPEALDEAEESGLVTSRDGDLALRHPLVRSAVYGATTTTRRRQAHRALADALAGTPYDDRRAWHLAASVDEPDDEVVAALDEAATRARRRGGHEAAAAAWARAAELTPDPEARARRLLAAAQSSLAAGRPLETEQLVRAALVDTDDALLRSELLQLRGQVEWNTRSLDEGYRTVCQAAATVADVDPARARVLAMLASSLAAFGARADDAPDPRTVVPAPGPGASDADLVTGWLLEGFSAVAARDWPTAATALRRACETPLGPDAHPLLPPNVAIATIHLGDDARALALHDLQLRTARDAGAVNMVEHALTRGAVFRIATGAWHEAASAAQEALLLDRSLGLDEITPFPLVELAVVAALRGDPEAPRLLAELDETLDRHPPRGATGGLVTDLRHWAAARQDGVAVATALHHLEQVQLPIVQGMAAIDRIETAVRAGRSDLAEAWVEDVEDFAAGTGMAWARAVGHHGRALLADGAAEEHLREALGWHEQSTRVPARARTELALGELLRRNRRRTDARVPLRSALDTFEQLGAVLWAERARQELRASGERARRGPDVAPTELTAQEAQVAALVRQGLSNKEVAGRLFISPRTVDFHLRNVYAKLGITSRTELAALAADPA
ncbi:helix-turn-helix transcriptional regulator [Nocardioides taihuensis]|uniref:AAA family ATPase n=1 Tax=Nocardioides taihuensis TaxID=1835606 RepID=A0ABW0BG59_9ACTN